MGQINDLGKQLLDAIGAAYPPEGERWLTLDGWVKECPCPRATMRDRLERACRLGTAESKQFTSRTSGKVAKHYRLI